MLKRWPSLQSRHLTAGVIYSPACSLSVQRKALFMIIVLLFPVVLVSLATCILFMDMMSSHRGANSPLPSFSQWSTDTKRGPTWCAAFRLVLLRETDNTEKMFSHGETELFSFGKREKIKIEMNVSGHHSHRSVSTHDWLLHVQDCCCMFRVTHVGLKKDSIASQQSIQTALPCVRLSVLLNPSDGDGLRDSLRLFAFLNS